MQPNELPGLEDISFFPTPITTHTFTIKCEADANDGDYINEETDLTIDEFLEIKDGLRKVVNLDLHDWDSESVCLTEESFERIDELVPHWEHGVHSPEFTITYTDSNSIPWDVSFK